MTIRNIAIIAHVDHGKTTLIDSIFKQCGTFRENQQIAERALDSNQLEQERGITILAKCTSVIYQDTKINIIDTPGHADFGGEVERVLSMADGVVLLVDAAEGPMPQTKFVLSKALKQNLKPIVVINKIDRTDARPDQVIDEVFDLFVNLGANDEQLDFHVLYASGRSGWCVKELEDEKKNLHPLLDLVIDHVPSPNVDENGPFKMLVTLLEADNFLGRVLTGKIISGKAERNMQVQSLDLNGKVKEKSRLTKLLGFNGLKREAVESAEAGDIIVVAGLAETSVSDTICDPSIKEPALSTPIDPPTMTITILVNDSPFAGTEGSKVTSTMIKDRLLAEAETNVAITLKESANSEFFEVGGRGELQLGVLIETMRREGFELAVSRPQVILKQDDHGNTVEPYEEVIIDVDSEFSGTVIDKMNRRKADMTSMVDSGAERVRLTFIIPSRGLIGYQSEFLTDTKGSGILNRVFHSYGMFKGEIPDQRNGALIATNTGEAVAYALFSIQDRGMIFVQPQEKIYQGMIIGEHSLENDLEVNALKSKQLTNVRASGTDENIKLTPPRKMSLENMISYIRDDELLEVTPKSLRLRKRFLDPNDRKRLLRAAKK